VHVVWAWVRRYLAALTACLAAAAGAGSAVATAGATSGARDDSAITSNGSDAQVTSSNPSSGVPSLTPSPQPPCTDTTTPPAAALTTTTQQGSCPERPADPQSSTPAKSPSDASTAPQKLTALPESTTGKSPGRGRHAKKHVGAHSRTRHHRHAGGHRRRRGHSVGPGHGGGSRLGQAQSQASALRRAAVGGGGSHLQQLPSWASGRSAQAGEAAAAPSASVVVTPWSIGFGVSPFTIAELEHLSSTIASADQPPQSLIPIYKAAGRRYHIPWEILAAINAVETHYGRDLRVSRAGAIGWMQFMPDTWNRWRLAVGRNHTPNPYDPSDSIYSTARFLAAHGAPQHMRAALYAYNHSASYVDAVLRRAQMIGGRSPDTGNGNGGYALPLEDLYMRQLGRTDGGVDIEDAPDGAAVYSITPGIVTAVASNPSGFGPNYPVIMATAGPLDGRHIYYGHVAASLVHVGQRVRAGQPIAVMGHTGNAATLGHGHVEIGFSDAGGDPLNHGSSGGSPSGAAMRQLLTTLSAAFGITNS
jgi:murein DD-endopeptidase MepM/ murein hydrolase activator NlpD